VTCTWWLNEESRNEQGNEKRSYRMQSACPIRVWNGIFAAGDSRPESDLKAISPNGDRNSETTTREKWATKTAFVLAGLNI